MDCSPPGSSVHVILQARILDWIAIPSSRGSPQPRDGTWVSSLLHWQAGSLPPAPLGSMTHVVTRNFLKADWKVEERESHSVLSDSLWPHALYSPWNSPCQNTEVGRSPGDLPNPGLNWGLLHYRRILYLLSHQGSPSFLTRESSHLNLDSWQEIRHLSESLIPGSCQSHVTPCNTMYCILPGSSVHGVL